jgi:phasin family protein
MAKKESQSPWPNLDVNELLKQIQIPGVDIGKWIDSQRDNIKALQEANQTAAQGLQSLMTRQAEILRESLEAWQNAFSESTSTPPAEIAQKQIELGQKAFAKALANMRELAEIAIKSQSEAADVIRKRLEQNLRDLQNR